MIMYENCDSDIVCGKYEENLAICIVMSAQVTISKAMNECFLFQVWQVDNDLTSNFIAHSDVTYSTNSCDLLNYSKRYGYGLLYSPLHPCFYSTMFPISYYVYSGKYLVCLLK